VTLNRARYARYAADRERAPAESEGEDPVAAPVVPAREVIEVEHVTLEAEPQHASDDGEGLERRRADAVAVVRDLLLRIAQIQRAVQSPHIGLEQLGGAVSGTIGQQHNVPRHAA
jgi:hypothetical protein